MDRKLRVVVADDHDLIREGLIRVIDREDDMEAVGEARNGEEAIRMADALQPAIVLVDVSMPGMSGVDATRAIRSASPRVMVIGITRHREPGFVSAMLEAGAAGYVLKQSASTELTRAIRAVAAGERYIDGSVRRRPAAPEPAAAAPAPNPAELTTEEEQVLRLVALGHTHHEIATTVSLDVPRVRAARAAAMSKIGVSSRGAIVRYADTRGWLQPSHSAEPASTGPGRPAD